MWRIKVDAAGTKAMVHSKAYGFVSRLKRLMDSATVVEQVLRLYCRTQFVIVYFRVDM